MNYFEPSFQPHPHYLHDSMSSQYVNTQPYAANQLSAPMMAMPNHNRTNETKPRLGKDEVDILEREFRKNQKPTTQIKRQFADEMGVDLARINNWFQNRRAKRKHEVKNEAAELAGGQVVVEYSEPSSPDLYSSHEYSSGTPPLLAHQQGSFPIMNSGPPAAIASYNPQYSDPSLASMESLHRTFPLAIPSEHEQFHTFEQHQDSFTDSLYNGFQDSDRAQFPSPDQSPAAFDNNQTSYSSSFTNGMYHGQVMTEQVTNQTPTPNQSYPNSGSDFGFAHSFPAFPSQQLPTQQCDSLPSPQRQSSFCQSPEEMVETPCAIGFQYQNIPESDESPVSPPGPSIPFRSPPPMDIASRRKKVHNKPAALISDNLRGRPSLPRTGSYAEGFRRPNESPAASAMRRIVSAGGNNRNVRSGRIYKSGIESAQRSPINLGVFADADWVLEHNYPSFRQASNASSNNLAPPTPMSPKEREMTFAKREMSRLTASPVNGATNYVFNAGTGQFTNLASPPETPQEIITVNPPSNSWTQGVEVSDSPWEFDTQDSALFTPCGDAFPAELHMAQPSYLASSSQPVTPAFGTFPPNVMFNGHESPQYMQMLNDSPQYTQLKNESPRYTLPTQIGAEYSFPQDTSHYVPGMSPSMNKQKQFQFSHTTPADFSDK